MDEIFLYLCKNGRLPFDQKFRNFRNRDNLYGNSPGKVPENTEIVEFPKSEPFNQKFRKFRDESQMERKFPGKMFRKFVDTSRGCPPFRNLCKFPIFHSGLGSSFGCDHNSELDISCKDGTHSIKETLLNLSTYLSVNTTAKLVKKAFYKNIVPVVYLFVLYMLAGKCTKIYNACRTIV